jgi:hypothetical protein
VERLRRRLSYANVISTLAGDTQHLDFLGSHQWTLTCPGRAQFISGEGAFVAFTVETPSDHYSGVDATNIQQTSGIFTLTKWSTTSHDFTPYTACSN